MWWHTVTWEGKWRGNWRMEWVVSTPHTTLEHGTSSITTTDVHTSAAGSQLNWCPRRFKWTCPFHQKTKCGSCACAITLQKQSTVNMAAVVDIDHWFGFSQTWCFGKTWSAAVACIDGENVLIPGLI